MTNPLLRYGVALAIGIATTGFALLCARYTDQTPYTRLYRAVPLSLAWAFGGLTLYSLLQMVLPFLDSPGYDTVGIFVPLGFGALAGIFFLCRRARYVEDTAALLVLLFALFVLVLINLAGVLPHPASPPSFLAYYAAGCALGSVMLLPCLWFDRWLQARLGPMLPLPAFIQSARAQRSPSLRRRSAIMISACGAVSSLAILAWLATRHQLDSFGAALPWTAAVMFGLYGLGTAIHWGLRYLFLGKPVYGPPPRPLATSVNVTVQPSDEQQAGWQLYQGPTLPDGTIPAEVQTQMDALLQSGKAASISCTFDNGLQEAQSLPSYCTGEWPRCQTSTCREAAVGEPPLPTQGGEE